MSRSGDLNPVLAAYESPFRMRSALPGAAG